VSRLHRFASPARFLRLADRVQPWTGWGALLLIGAGLAVGFGFSPPDYQQGDTVRIMYVHVPSAWMALFCYTVMVACAAAGLIWRHQLAHVIAHSAAPVGAGFTGVCLATGMLWGKPMWGTYWVWDARLTSELILLFLYFGVIGLHAAIEDRRTAGRAAGLFAIVGVVNVPIIHYSVEWWHTLHQGPTVTKLSAPSIHVSMLVPLLLMAVSFKLFYAAVLLKRVRCEVLERERSAGWVRELLVRPESN